MFKNHSKYDDFVSDFIEENEESLYERYTECYPEGIHSDWILGEHIEEVSDWVESFLEDELDEYIFNKLFQGRVLITPENSELFNRLVSNETYIGESEDTLTMHSTYMGKQYIVTAVKYHDVFVVVSIYNNEDHKECLL